MPFTTSHPAAVLPIKQIFGSYSSLTGLMAGAMAPDLLYFLTLTTEFRGFSHSWAGLFVFCLPAGILFSFVFHNLFKYQLIRNLPSPLDRKLAGLAQSTFKVKSSRAWIILILSVAVGTLTHFAWDALTHPEGELARRIPFFLSSIDLFGRPRQVSRIFQHVSTITGWVVIIIYVLKGNIIPAPQNVIAQVSIKEKVMFWVSGSMLSLAAAWVMVLIFNDLFGWVIEDGFKISLAQITFGLTGWTTFFCWTIVYGLLVRRVRF